PNNTVSMPLMTRAEFLFLGWWTWGGSDGREAAIVSATGSILCAELLPDGVTQIPDFARGSRYAAKYRPLNQYIYNGIGDSDRYNMKLFECPSDTGYPFEEEIDDMDNEAKRQRMYDSRGNSYRGSFFCYLSPANISTSLTMSPAGHRLSSVPNIGDSIAFGEPLFFNMVGRNGSASDTPNPVNLIGWHKRPNTDNVAFLDGSARATYAERLISPEPSAQADLNVANITLLARGPNYRLDVYPSGGAALVKVRASFPTSAFFGGIPGTVNQWPKQGFQDLLIQD
ncbi:MAG: hypothetical protein AB7N71_07295, partial [Phycisphaerae bacterium]